jgi:hypothetical protein
LGGIPTAVEALGPLDLLVFGYGWDDRWVDGLLAGSANACLIFLKKCLNGPAVAGDGTTRKTKINKLIRAGGNAKNSP